MAVKTKNYLMPTEGGKNNLSKLFMAILQFLVQPCPSLGWMVVVSAHSFGVVPAPNFAE